MLNLVQEENSASMINDENDNFTGDDQEFLLTDDTRQEIIITSFDVCCGMEELPLLVLDSEPMNEVEGNIKNDSEDNSSWLERIEIKRLEEEVDTERIMEEETKSVNLVEEDEEGYSSEEYVMGEEAVGAEKMTADTTVAMLWVEDEEEEEDSSEEYVMDEGDESSEETGSTSAETNAEVIWPAESMEVLSLELKNIMINTQSLESKEKIVEEDGSTKIEELFNRGIATGSKEHLSKPARFIIINWHDV